MDLLKGVLRPIYDVSNVVIGSVLIIIMMSVANVVRKINEASWQCFYRNAGFKGCFKGK